MRVSNSKNNNYRSMNQFVQRIVNYVANEILIKGLANSKTFQRFAVKTDQSLKEVHKKGTERFQSTFETLLAKEQEELARRNAMMDNTKNNNNTRRQPPIKPLTGISGFVSAFVKEIRKDWSSSGDAGRAAGGGGG